MNGYTRRSFPAPDGPDGGGLILSPERKPERPLRFCLLRPDNEFIPPGFRDGCALKIQMNSRQSGRGGQGGRRRLMSFCKEGRTKPSCEFGGGIGGGICERNK
jgi:hypothetical protein